jgi:hypothetical protein
MAENAAPNVSQLPSLLKPATAEDLAEIYERRRREKAEAQARRAAHLAQIEAESEAGPPTVTSGQVEYARRLWFESEGRVREPVVVDRRYPNRGLQTQEARRLIAESRRAEYEHLRDLLDTQERREERADQQRVLRETSRQAATITRFTVVIGASTVIYTLLTLLALLVTLRK